MAHCFHGGQRTLRIHLPFSPFHSSKLALYRTDDSVWLMQGALASEYRRWYFNDTYRSRPQSLYVDGKGHRFSSMHLFTAQRYPLSS